MKRPTIDDLDLEATGVLPDTLDELTETLESLQGVSIGAGNDPIEKMHPWAVRRLNKRLARLRNRKRGRPKVHWKTRRKKKREADRRHIQRKRAKLRMSDRGNYKLYCDWWKGRKYKIELSEDEFVEIVSGLNCATEIRLYPDSEGVVSKYNIWIVDRDDPHTVVYDGKEQFLKDNGYVV